MKIKYTIFILLFISLTQNTTIAQGNCELVIENKNSVKNLYVRIYPVSMVFNGAREGLVDKPGYNLIGRKKFTQPSWLLRADFIAGVYSQNDSPVHVTTLYPYNPNGSDNKFCLQHDNEGLVGSAKALFGYGKYRVDLWYDVTVFPVIETPPKETFTIDIDADYGIGGPAWYDLRVFWYGENDIRYQIGAYCVNTPLPTNRNIEVWNPCPSHTRPKNPGNFKYDNGTTETPNPYAILPMDPRRECTSVFLPGAPNQNHEFLSNDIGILTLNLTIDKDINTPETIWSQEYPGLAPIIIANDAFLIINKGVNNSQRLFTFKNIYNTTYGTSLKIEAGGMMDLQAAETTEEKAHVKFESYCNTEIEHNGVLRLKKNSLWEMTGTSEMIWYPNSAIVFSGSSVNPNNYGKILLKDNSVLTNCGAFISGPLNVTQEGGTIRFVNDCAMPLSGGPFETVIDSGGSITVMDESILEVGAGGKMIFDGIESHLKLEPGSIVKFGEGASIEFRNGAYLDADGCTFTSESSGEIWEGILLDGAGSVTNIRNCTFNDAAASITVTNTICNIANNTFNFSNNSSCIYGINAVNETNITIAGNTFNAGSNSVAECIRFFNYDGDGLPGGGGSSAYTLNIYNNTFNGSLNAIAIQCLTASQLPFYIANNSFYPAGSITSNGIYAYNITGNIKNNYFHNANSNKSILLQFSTVNLFNNNLYSVNQNIWSSNSTLMQMAPVLNAFGQWVWYGGYNTLNSGSLHNIEFRSYSNPTISPNGLNCFTVTTQPNLLGELCLGTKPYKAYENFWSPSVSGSSFDITCNSNPVNVTYTPNLSTCPVFDPDGSTGTNVTDLTNGIYDTVYITSGGEGGSYPGSLKKTSNNADILYFEALQKRKQRDYAGAINKCKELINEHDTSSYFNSAMSELYLNYLESDTTGNQTITNGLFNNLKTYIEQKMQQYPNNAQLIERAYKYHLMCLVKVKSYTEAIAGYENIMNNHPDPIVRLNASWDRSAVVFMMGQGGSENDNPISSSKSRNIKLLDKNPAHRIARDIFREQKVQSEQIEKNISDEQLSNEDISSVVYTKEEKQMLERRIENYNPTDKKDFMEKLSKDIRLIEQINTAKNTKKTNANVPRSFKLHQNYPNPFNPTTTIKYEIPKDAEITINVYDLLGRELFSINEYKKAGSYEVKFDGANLASGMYLYKLVVGDNTNNGGIFSDTKKMVLLK